MTLYQSIKRWLTPSSDTVVETREFIQSNQAIEDGEYVAFLGDPEVVFLSRVELSPRIRVPVDGPPGVGDLVFDLPEHEDSIFYTFCDAIDADPFFLDDVEGTVVPIRYSGGNPLVMWDQADGVPGPDESIRRV